MSLAYAEGLWSRNPEPKQFWMARAGAENVLDDGAGAKTLHGGAGAEIWLPAPQK